MPACTGLALAPLDLGRLSFGGLRLTGRLDGFGWSVVEAGLAALPTGTAGTGPPGAPSTAAAMVGGSPMAGAPSTGVSALCDGSVACDRSVSSGAATSSPSGVATSCDESADGGTSSAGVPLSAGVLAGLLQAQTLGGPVGAVASRGSPSRSNQLDGVLAAGRGEAGGGGGTACRGRAAVAATSDFAVTDCHGGVGSPGAPA